MTTKLLEQITNHQSEKDVLSLMNAREGIDFGDLNPDPRPNILHHRADMQLIGKPLKCSWQHTGPAKAQLIHVREEMGLSCSLQSTYYTFKGFYFGNTKVKIGAYLVLEDKRQQGRLPKRYSIEPEREDTTVWIGKVDTVANIILEDGKTPSWMRLEAFSCVSLSDGSMRCPILQMEGMAWIPMGASIITVIRLPFVVPHPDPSKKLFVYNRWVRREVNRSGSVHQ
jgi:hypothetical protein